MSFENIILSNIIYNEAYTRKVSAFLEPDFFTDEADKIVLTSIKDFINKYNVNPTLEALAINISNTNLPENKMVEVMTLLNDLKKDDNSVEWLFDETEKFCQTKALYNAIYKSIEIMEGEEKSIDKNGIPSLLTDALALSFDVDVGHDYWEDAEKQWEYKHSLTTKQKFSIDVLNRVTKGGVPDKTLNCVVMEINGGKSTYLIQQAADWLIDGKNALYITMEMAEEVCRERIDVSVMDFTFDMVEGMSKQDYVSKVHELKQKTAGRLFVKEFPAGAAHVNHFRHLLQELKIKKGFVPDVIFIDYLTICASSKLPASAKGNTNTYYTSVAEEIRAFAVEQKVPVWTGLQFDKSTQGKADGGIGNVGLAIGISATADFMVAFFSPEELKERGQLIGKVIKNRYSDFKGKFILGINNAKQKFFDVDTQAIAMTEDELKELGIKNIIPAGAPKVDVKQATMDWCFD